MVPTSRMWTTPRRQRRSLSTQTQTELSNRLALRLVATGHAVGLPS
jgi:hypothetical protein